MEATEEKKSEVVAVSVPNQIFQKIPRCPACSHSEFKTRASHKMKNSTYRVRYVTCKKCSWKFRIYFS